MTRSQAPTFLSRPLKASWPACIHTSPPWLGSERGGGGQGSEFQKLPCSDLTPGRSAPLCVRWPSARYLYRVRRCPGAAPPGSRSPIAVSPVPGEPRRAASAGPRLLGAGRGSAAGANPPARRPARRLAGRPSKTVRHGFPVGSPLRRTNPAALISPARARWAGGRARGRGPRRGCGGRARRPGLLPRSHSFG